MDDSKAQLNKERKGEKSMKNKLKDERGAAMVLVICLMAVVVTLSLVMVFSSSSLAAASQREVSQEQIRLATIDMSKSIGNELMSSTGGLYEYLFNNISLFGQGSWSYYNEDELGHANLDMFKREFEATDANSDIKFTVEIYWRCNEEAFSDESDSRYSNADLVLTVIGESDKGKIQKITETYTAKKRTAVQGGADVEWYAKGTD